MPRRSSFNKGRPKSPLLGISALNSQPQATSQQSLVWDSFALSPWYFKNKIPIVSTPSTNLDSSRESLSPSVIMTVKRCSKCHLYISGAPTPDLSHNGKFGPECQNQHHPNPCTYVHKDNGPCTVYSNRNEQPPPTEEQSKFEKSLAGGSNIVQSKPVNESSIMSDCKQLLLTLNKTSMMVRLFLGELMTMDCLGSYEKELKDVQNKLLEFCDMVMNYSFNDYDGQVIPKTKEGQIMNAEYWQNVQNDLERRVTLHQIEIRGVANKLKENRTLTEFEKRELEIKEKELQLKEEQIELMRQSQNKSEAAEKSKANAVAQS